MGPLEGACADTGDQGERPASAGRPPGPPETIRAPPFEVSGKKKATCVLQGAWKSGGGGDRTRVSAYFSDGFYVCSLSTLGGPGPCDPANHVPPLGPRQARGPAD